MTKKHFKAIAEIIKFRMDATLYSPPVEVLAKDLAQYFKQDNPRFDRERFLAACGIEESVKA